VKAQRLLPERVYRFYQGGALLGRFRGVEEDDDFFPEDWVGSVTHAANPGRDEPEAGLSRLASGELLRDAIAADPASWLGGAESPGVLVKLLDAAERLPVHYHPDRPFARAHFNSSFGKTEAWVVLATRNGTGDVWIGLREPVDRETYLGWIERQETEQLLDSLNRLAVGPGDVVYVPAGVPHAIGAGLLIAELQEPTDFSIVCEWKGFPISPDDAHLGQGWGQALDAANLDKYEPGLRLPEEAREFFWADEVAEPAGRFAILIVTAGQGTIDGEPARRGDCFALPASAETLDVEGDLRILRCLGPK
jgi:mannose-6-phosphate isomerase